MITENHRFLPAHRYIKEAVSRGLIGDVFLGRSYEGAFETPERIKNPDCWMFSWEKGGGGALHDQGAHKFAVWNWLLGEVEAAMCLCSKTLDSPPVKGEDTAMVMLKYKCGALVEVTVTTAAIHASTNRIELHGTRGSIVEDHDWEKPVRIYSLHESAEHRGTVHYPEIEHGAFPMYYTISFRIEVDHFADCILNDTAPEFSPEEAREAIAVSQLAYFAAKRGCLTTMAEFREFITTEGTPALFEGIDKMPLDSYRNLRW
jgi:predicted dehydrogenase